MVDPAEHQHLLESHASLKARVAMLEGTDAPKLRAALINIARQVGAALDEGVSSDFLVNVPEEVRLVLKRRHEESAAAVSLAVMKARKEWYKKDTAP